MEGKLRLCLCGVFTALLDDLQATGLDDGAVLTEAALQKEGTRTSLREFDATLFIVSFFLF